MNIKSVADAGKKFTERVAVATDEYKSGINRTNDQAEKAIAAKDAYVAGIQDAIDRGAREKGLEAAGTAKWKNKALAVGVSRWPQGAKAGVGDYQKNVAPYFDTIASIELSPRGPKGSPENYDRVRTIGEALHAKKIGA
jgi:hypothetical protein